MPQSDHAASRCHSLPHQELRVPESVDQESAAAVFKAAPSAPSPATERLAGQLSLLSKLVEAITYRMLELEERCSAQESQLRSLQQQTGGAAVELKRETEWRLDDTEQRLLQLESLLNGLDGVPVARHLHPVGPQAHHRSAEGADPIDAPFDAPFMEEPEQPFMDDENPRSLGFDELSA